MVASVMVLRVELMSSAFLLWLLEGRLNQGRPDSLQFATSTNFIDLNRSRSFCQEKSPTQTPSSPTPCRMRPQLCPSFEPRTISGFETCGALSAHGRGLAVDRAESAVAASVVAPRGGPVAHDGELVHPPVRPFPDRRSALAVKVHAEATSPLAADHAALGHRVAKIRHRQVHGVCQDAHLARVPAADSVTLKSGV